MVSKAFYANPDSTRVVEVDITCDHGDCMACTVPSPWKDMAPRQHVPLPTKHLHPSFAEAKLFLIRCMENAVERKKHELRHAEERLAKVNALTEPEPRP